MSRLAVSQAATWTRSNPLYKVGGSYQFIYSKKSASRVDFPNMQNRKQDGGFSGDTQQSETRDLVTTGGADIPGDCKFASWETKGHLLGLEAEVSRGIIILSGSHCRPH